MNIDKYGNLLLKCKNQTINKTEFLKTYFAAIQCTEHVPTGIRIALSCNKTKVYQMFENGQLDEQLNRLNNCISEFCRDIESYICKLKEE